MLVSDRPSDPLRPSAGAGARRVRPARPHRARLRAAPDHRPRARRALPRARPRRLRAEVALHRRPPSAPRSSPPPCRASRALGTITLNHAVGGLNAAGRRDRRARRARGSCGCRPSSAANEIGESSRRPRRQRAGLGALRARPARGGRATASRSPVVDEDGRAAAASCCEVLDVVAATTSCSPPGTSRATRSSRSSTRPSTPACATIVVTHPEFPRQRISRRRPARAGRTRRADRALLHHAPHRQVHLGADLRRRPARSAPRAHVWGSDLGQLFNPPVEDGLALMADRLPRGRLHRGGGPARWPSTNTRRLAAVPMSRACWSIGAHSADFVWRAGGAIAVATRAGGDRPGDRALLRRARRVGRAVEAAEARRSRTSSRSATPRPRRPPRRSAPSSRRSTSATTRSRSGRSAWRSSSTRSASSRPTCSITHTDTDPFNPDHPVAYAAVERARSLAAGAGVASAFDDDHAARSCSCSSPTSPSCATSCRPRSSTSRR